MHLKETPKRSRLLGPKKMTTEKFRKAERNPSEKKHSANIFVVIAKAEE